MKPKLIDTSVLPENYIDTNFPKLKNEELRNWKNISIENWLKGLNQTITHKGKTLMFGKDYITEYVDGKLIIKLLNYE